jgi:hypothetical protein
MGRETSALQTEAGTLPFERTLSTDVRQQPRSRPWRNPVCGHPAGSSYRLLMLPGALEPVGPVDVPADPPEVLAPGVAGLVGPVELPAEPPELLRPKPGEVLPAAPGTPVGAPTAPPFAPWANVGVAFATTSDNATRMLADLKTIGYTL